MQKSLPDRPSLEQLKKQAKELVKNHRAQDASTFALIREFLPALTGKTDEEIVLYPFALHDAQSVIARQYGFPGWNQMRDHVENLEVKARSRFTPEASVEAKFDTICQAYAREDYALFCSVMNDTMRDAISEEHFKSVCATVADFFKKEYSAVYFGEMSQGEHAVHFWRVSVPGKHTDLMTRVGVKDDLVSGLLLSAPFAGKPRIGK